MTLFNRIVDSYDVLYRVYMRGFGKIRPKTRATTTFGAKLICLRSDFIQRRIAFFGLFEPNLTYFISHTLKPGDIFIDVGANIGYFTLLASKCVSAAGKVYAIEAAPSTYQLLLDNMALNDSSNVRAMNVAVADKDCYVRFPPANSRNIGASKVAYTDDAEAGAVLGRPLPAIVGPDFAHASFIKVDVEGAEAVILPGIFDALAELNSSAILVAEVNKESTYLIELAKSKGFQVKAIPNNYSISHLLVRAFLRRTEEDEFFILREVDSYISDRYDYVFSRTPS